MLRTLLVRGTTRLPSVGSPVVATIGSFDGIHRGHIALLEKLQQLKSEYIQDGQKPTSIAISFHPHPAIVLKKNPNLKLLTSLRQRLEIFSKYDIDIFYMVHFTLNFSHYSAEDFIDKVLIKELNVNTLILGEDAAFGYNREGNVDFLKKALEKRGRRLIAVPKVLQMSERISSEAIRGLLRDGRVADIKELLGRNFILDSYVTEGCKIGRTLGYPTANLKENEQIWPCDGVYITRCYINDLIYPALTNIGVCPTFGKDKRSLETHILSNEKFDLYNKRIQIEFLERLRSEKRFQNMDELKKQISEDIKAANVFFM